MPMGKLSKSEEIYWNDILTKFESYTGSVKDFCNEHEIDKRKLYYRRKLKNLISHYFTQLA